MQDHNAPAALVFRGFTSAWRVLPRILRGILSLCGTTPSSMDSTILKIFQNLVWEQLDGPGGYIITETRRSVVCCQAGVRSMEVVVSNQLHYADYQALQRLLDGADAGLTLRPGPRHAAWELGSTS